MLAGVAVVKHAAVVRKFHRLAPRDGLGGGFALAQAGKVAQVTLGVRPGAVRGEPGGAVDFKDALEVVPGGGSALGEKFLATRQVVVAFLLTLAGGDGREVADGVPKRRHAEVANAFCWLKPPLGK